MYACGSRKDMNEHRKIQQCVKPYKNKIKWV